MKKSGIFLMMLALMVVSLSSMAAASKNEKRIALVIGNSAYESAPLPNPVNDARLMTRALRSVGFEVREHLNSSQKELKTAIRDFGRKLTDAGQDGVGVFYYAGHGIQVGGQNYLIPVDANIERETDVSIEGINTSHVLSAMDLAQSRLNFVILDACRNNPYARSFRSGTQGLARMDAPRGSLIAYATGPGSVAADGENGNSPYTLALATAIQSGQPVERMFRSVRNSVMEKTKGMQVPWESSSLTGDDFFFNPSLADNSKNKTTTLQVPESQSDPDVVFWDTVRDSNDKQQYQAYLNAFPSGQFRSIAELKIKQLQGNGNSGFQSAPQQQMASLGMQPSNNLNNLPQSLGSAPMNVENTSFVGVTLQALPIRPIPDASIPPGPNLGPGTVINVTGTITANGQKWVRAIGPNGENVFVFARYVKAKDELSDNEVQRLTQLSRTWQNSQQDNQGGGFQPQGGGISPSRGRRLSTAWRWWRLPSSPAWWWLSTASGWVPSSALLK